MPDQISDDDSRPSPDALLEKAAQEGRGRFKIFLGAAPGVGKTWEMLQSGRARQADGVDVVIGVVETHGRRETAALVEGFELIDRREIDYRGQKLDEMDLDAIIARAPALVLVDELAHTNAPGSRHPKRYLDVLELLDRGIDVYTTLNIQHVESLNDVVAQITRIRVRETVPDSVIDRADDIEIIDITPDDLIKRLNEGKVYLPRTAQRAIRNYFSPGNLTALRELALRRTAQRVDEQLLNHMQSQGIRGSWPSGDRILVCIDGSARGPALVRYGKRQADRMRASWSVLHVELAGDSRLSEARKDQIAATLRLAGRLGGEAVTLPGQTVTREILRYAGGNNVSHVIVGHSPRPRWRDWFDTPVSQELIREAGGLNIHVIAGSDPSGPVSRRGLTLRGEAGFHLLPWLLAVLYVGIATAIGMALFHVMGVRNIGLIFLMAVLTSAATAGLWPALFTSVLGALAYNYFFLWPLYTLAIDDAESVVAFVTFLAAAALTSNLTARVHRAARVARARARTTESLYLFSKRLSIAATLDDVLWVAVNHMASMLRVNTVLLLPEGNRVTVRAGFPPDDTLADFDIAAAQWAFEHNHPAGRGADTLPGARRLYLPLRTGRQTIGVVGLDNDKTGPLLTPDQQRLFDALADQAALAIERIQLVGDLDKAKLGAEADRLRSALLTSISHDLRTPLAAIMGAAGTLRDYFTALPEAGRRDLLLTVVDESERLNRFIANLLDMTRIESGATAPNLSTLALDEALGAVLRRAGKLLAQHRTEVSLPEGLPMLRLDPVLFEQVLFNLLDNAAKYAPAQSLIRITARTEGGQLILQIQDEGPGIPEADLERVFDIFYRVLKGDQVQAGTGLGLAICRGFITAMGGTITAQNRRDRSGAVFTLRLPVPVDARLPEVDE
ncbi:sensor histidine kinase [Pseudogemmobacter faecipullorum]|uniref:histidine kinase n=1 Tax=Pseudogemmobacter faecipullorum TaxID=2755041 RepID=A0ABS8CNG8_9RHOB|nr:sensor histidine kinase KdpD [Pseudogemmobacter faecipullorum]MCB5410929.1 sensor histidine kinase KdpD [Pseudogemmobacter faecipullorum]